MDMVYNDMPPIYIYININKLVPPRQMMFFRLLIIY